MKPFPTYAAPGYQFDAIPDLSRLETRERFRAGVSVLGHLTPASWEAANALAAVTPSVHT